MTAPPEKLVVKRPLLIAGAVAVVVCLGGSGVLFASSEGAVSVAKDAAVQVRVQETIGNMSVSRAIMSEALILGVAYDNDSVPEEVFGAVLAEAQALIADLEARRSSLDVFLPNLEIDAALLDYLGAARALLADLQDGRFEQAQGTDSVDLRTAYDRATGALVAERDARERHIAAVRAGVGTVADAARFVVAFFVPAFVLLLAFALAWRRQRRIRLESEIEHESKARTARDSFLSAVAHELRTPLTAVVGFAETLRDPSRNLSPKDRDELVNILAGQASDTAFVVEDLLVFARGNVADLTIRPEVVAVHDLIEKVAMTWGGLHGGRLTLTGQATAWADPLRMKQVLRNLLSNAFNHGGPKVDVRISQDGAQVKVEVADNGPGIPAELRPRVFEPYQHGITSNNGAASLGLGLPVAKSLSLLMDGSLKYSYENGESVFSVTLPGATENQEKQSKRKPRIGSPQLSGGQILEAIQQRQFEIVYQPIFDLRHLSGDNQVVGFEALARFPVGSPPEWFSAAAGVGIGVELELEAIRAAIEGFRPAPHRAFLAINTSIQTLTSPGFVEALSGISPSRIVLELSEDTVIDNYPRAKAYLDRLTRQGYKLAFDDLAAGRIDLWYLVRLRPAIIKIDISLVHDIDSEPTKRALVNGLKWLSDVLNSKIVAEGIERVEELELLTRIGAHYGQGYLLGRPGPLDSPINSHLGPLTVTDPSFTAA